MLEKLTSVNIYINLNSKIQLKVPILSFLPILIIDALERISPSPTLAMIPCMILFSRKFHSQIMKILEQTTAFFKIEDITS